MQKVVLYIICFKHPTKTLLTYFEHHHKDALFWFCKDKPNQQSCMHPTLKSN